MPQEKKSVMDFKRNLVIALNLARKSQPAIVREFKHLKVLSHYKCQACRHKKTTISYEIVRKVKECCHRRIPNGFHRPQAKSILQVALKSWTEKHFGGKPWTIQRNTHKAQMNEEQLMAPHQNIHQRLFYARYFKV